MPPRSGNYNIMFLFVQAFTCLGIDITFYNSCRGPRLTIPPIHLYLWYTKQYF